jgi:aminocarboxymuconate-semialdehyde decarboxylase
MTVIDVHTHMFGTAWRRMYLEHGGEGNTIARREDGREYLIIDGEPNLVFPPAILDYDLFVKGLDESRVDIAIMSLTTPNVHWGSAETSAETARLVNDEMAEAQAAYPDRLRFLASLPWEYPELAVAELERSRAKGAVGVMVLAHINHRHLTDPLFEPVWQAIDRHGLPVLVHPTTPFGAAEVDYHLERRFLIASVGYTFDTTLAITRIVSHGFLDRYPNMKIIASHGGGYVPFIASRLDLFFRAGQGVANPTIALTEEPTEYLGRLYYDAVVYRGDALQMCINLAGADHVLFGSDFPMPADFGILHDLTTALPDDQSKAIRGRNALRIFKL